MNKNRAVAYLMHFENKQLDKIENMLSRDCTLRDWETDVSGRENVLSAMRGIFESVKDLSVDIHNIYDSDNATVVEMDIVIDENKIHVVDVIEFTSSQISSIRAYKG